MLTGCCERAFLSAAARAAVADGIRLFLGGVWIFAALSKARDLAAARDVVARLLPARVAAAAPVFARFLVAAELLLSVWLILGWHKHVAAGISAGAFAVFAAAIGAADLRGVLPEHGCGCFGGASGPGLAVNETAARAIARNLVLIALAFVVATQP